jgi:hypothetical protein
MARQRPEQASRRTPREQGQKWIPPEEQQRISKTRDDEKEDQADSGPDKDHQITREGRVK